MTEVINSCDTAMEDFGVAAASGDQSISFQGFPDSHDHYPKLSKRLPSIVVEPTEAGEVESGELRWPPDDQSPTDVTQAVPPRPPTTGSELYPAAEEMARPRGEDSN